MPQGGKACGVRIHHISHVWKLCFSIVHMCTTTVVQNKWIEKNGEWGSAIKTICLERGHATVGARKQRWQARSDHLGSVSSMSERSDKELELEEQRCTGGGRGQPGKFWKWGCWNKVLHPQLFYSAIYWRAGARLLKSPFTCKIPSEWIAQPVRVTTHKELKQGSSNWRWEAGRIGGVEE